MAQQTSYQQVLEVALAHVVDTRTLAACCLVSQQLRHLIQVTVQHNLLRLVQHCEGALPTREGRRCLLVRTQLPHLQCLCKQGAAAVNTSEAGRAILQVLGHSRLDEHSLAKLLHATGLVMTNELLAFVAEHEWQRLPDVILSTCDLSQVDAAHRFVASLSAHRAPQPVTDDVRATYSGVTAADFPGLLHAACRRSPMYACLLIDHDRDHLHLLHPASNPPASTRSGVRQTSAASRQQQQQDTGTNQLLLDLLEHVVRQRNNHVLERLCQVPGAQQLSTLQVTRLLYLATCNAGKQFHDQRPCVMALLTRLPGARGVSTDSIVTLLTHGIEGGRWQHALPLLQLPAAKRISSAALCRLLLACTARMDLEDLFTELSRLADGRTLDSQDVVQVVRAFIDRPHMWETSPDYSGGFFDFHSSLDVLDPGRHLGGGGILDLLEYCIQKRHAMYAQHTYNVGYVCDLKPAAGQITDLPRFVAALTTLAKRNSNMPGDLLSTGVGPVMLQLQAADWLQILQAVGCVRLSEEVLQLPALQQMTADQVGQLVRAHAACVPRNPDCETDGIVLLAALPAAQQLTPQFLVELLLTLLDCKQALYRPCHHEAWEALLQLPAAQLISQGVLQQIIDTAAGVGCGEAIHSLRCLLPQAAELQCGLSSEQLGRGLLLAFTCEAAKVLMQEAGIQQLCVQELASLSVQVLAPPPPDYSEEDAVDFEVEGRTVPSWVWLLDALLQLPAAQQLGSRDVTQLLQAFLLRWDAAGRMGCFAHLLDLLPAAREISADQLLQMLTELSQRLKTQSVWIVLQQLQQLPAWDLLSAAELLRAVKLCLGQHLAKYRASAALCTQLSEVLLQHPASGQLPGAGVVDLLTDILGRRGRTAALVEVLLQHPAAAAAVDVDIACKLLAECLASTESADVLAVLLRLPAAQELSAQQVSALAHQALHRQDAACCQLLCTHPAVALGADRELQLLLEVVQQQGFSMTSSQHSSRRLCSCPRCTELAAAAP